MMADRSRRISELVKRSAPNGRRPRLPTEYEDLLREVDLDMAACYASMEDMEGRLDGLAESIDEDLGRGGVIIGEIDREDSVVTHIKELGRDAEEEATSHRPSLVSVKKD
jgi:hypothetical protein